MKYCEICGCSVWTDKARYTEITKRPICEACSNGYTEIAIESKVSWKLGYEKGKQDYERQRNSATVSSTH
jgi:hypothetical protein